MKHCFKCGERKPLSEFYRHSKMSDGHVNKCKECNKRDVRENRKNKVEYYREYDRSRYREDPEVAMRHRRYQKTDEGKASMEASRRRWSEENLIKVAASTMVGNAVRDGKLTKPGQCENCGDSPNRLHGHRDDYAHPLSVRWLCPACHKEWHDKYGEAPNGR